MIKQTIHALAVMLALSAAVAAQTSDQVFADGTVYARQEQPSTNAVFDAKILNGLYSFTSNGQALYQFASFREFTIFRQPHTERGLTVVGAGNVFDTDTYVEPLFIESGTYNPNHPGVGWNSAITIHSPRHPERVTGHSHGLWIDDQHVAGVGHPVWYDGSGNRWSVDADGSTWTWTASPYVSGSWSRFGFWCEQLECYIDSQAANAGIAPLITIKGPGLGIESAQVTVDGQQALTGQCAPGTQPTFRKGLAVGCQ